MNRIGDNITITGSDSVARNTTVSDLSNAYTFSIKGQGELTGATFTVERKILNPKVSSYISSYDYLTRDFANVQNSYTKFNHDVLVASPSLPYYHETPLNFDDREIWISKWKEYCNHLNQKVQFNNKDSLVEGRFLDIDDNGNAIVDIKSKKVVISSGILEIL